MGLEPTTFRLTADALPLSYSSNGVEGTRTPNPLLDVKR